MDLKKIVKDLNGKVKHFDKEENRRALITNLQILSGTDDLSVFEASSYEGSELFVSLYELLTNHSSDSELVWCVVSVLGVAVHNPCARATLVHTYHFIHPLTILLDTQLTREKKSAILKIIQELSFGVVISWQEAHLSKLIGILVSLMMDEDDQLTPLSLGVLVNLLHNNKPAIYTLMDCVDIKKLIRKVVNLHRDNVETSVQVCKLLMVLDHLSSNVPDAEILTFVRVSFIRIRKAFLSGNYYHMRHIVHFFRDAKDSKHGRKVLLTYPHYPEEINKLMEAVKSRESADWQCAQQMVEFLLQLVDLEMPAVTAMFTFLAQVLLRLVSVDNVAPAVLQLFSVMLRQSRNKDEQEYKRITSCLGTQLQMFIEILHTNCKADTSKASVRDLLVGLFHLFHELNENSAFCSLIATQVDKELVKNLLLPLVTLNPSDENQLFHHPLTELCVEVLGFLSELSLDDKEWLFLYSELLQKKQILKILAIALYSGTYEVKKQILYLAGTTSFSSDCLTGMSKYLADLNQLFLLPSPPPRNPRPDLITDTPSPTTQIDFAPRFSKGQSESLNSLIQKLEDLIAKNKIQDLSLAGIIELYNYKLTEVQRAERSLQSSLEAADKHRTQLSHRVAQLSAETGRLHQLLYSSHQSVESCQSESELLREQLRAAQESASSSHIKFKQLKQDVSSKSMIIKEQSEEISKMKRVIEDQEKRCETLDQKTADLEKKSEVLKQTLQNLEAEKSDLQAANTKMLGLIKGLEKTIKEKEKEVGDLEKRLAEKEKDLQESERTRKLIFDIVGGKKK
ncbi:uncharacterized protein LOC128986323 [Macrosteles quadrilineatus]|uniref:uncharacterized protein LOC128986323 n=1 Tax=Macrosteles quadrilineatus TaxID=74068 RepID=UPI0023E32A73|nr:uncharacterized protein LOC128986323 [Macrosteles quadrilineatus]XP_054262618.1 uncharacterized protein LOC128986323 [Macrosteles quadrilineatus]